MDDNTKRLFDYCRKHRDGIRNKAEMASLCLICGSIHIIPSPDNNLKLVCRDCRHSFFRYKCRCCDATIDGRDPKNPHCERCGIRVCTCGACGCSIVKNIGGKELPCLP